MKKQTAVKWLIEQISYKTTNGEIISYHKDISKLVEQAKEMEKQQIIDFADEYGTYILKGGQMSATTYIKLE